LGKKQLYAEHVQDRKEVASTEYNRNRENIEVEGIADDMDDIPKWRCRKNKNERGNSSLEVSTWNFRFSGINTKEGSARAMGEGIPRGLAVLRSSWG
jgi:hypothetical protein